MDEKNTKETKTTKRTPFPLQQLQQDVLLGRTVVVDVTVLEEGLEPVFDYLDAKLEIVFVRLYLGTFLPLLRHLWVQLVHELEWLVFPVNRLDTPFRRDLVAECIPSTVEARTKFLIEIMRIVENFLTSVLCYIYM